MSRKQRFLIAVLDDYQRVALRMADWSVLDAHAEVAAFNDHLNDPESVIARLQPYHIICVMRERTPLTRAILKRLPNLRLIASTGARNASIDAEAAQELGISVTNTGYFAAPTIEFTWAMILGVSRHLVDEANSVRTGGWQVQVGEDLGGKTLALLGLGNIGSAMARIGRAFGMRIIAWSQNLTPERAAEHEAEYVSKEQLFRQADILSIHLILSKRTRDLVSADDL